MGGAKKGEDRVPPMRPSRLAVLSTPAGRESNPISLLVKEVRRLLVDDERVIIRVHEGLSQDNPLAGVTLTSFILITKY
jgi:hypothetical protein